LFSTGKLVTCFWKINPVITWPQISVTYLTNHAISVHNGKNNPYMVAGTVVNGCPKRYALSFPDGIREHFHLRYFELIKTDSFFTSSKKPLKKLIQLSVRHDRHYKKTPNKQKHRQSFHYQSSFLQSSNQSEDIPFEISLMIL
jgi:hypothetical protein